MPVYKDKKAGTWYVSFWYTAWDGSKKKNSNVALQQKAMQASLSVLS